MNAALGHWVRKCQNMGINIEDDKLFTLSFANDQMIMAENSDDIHYTLIKLDEKYENNQRKNEYVVIGGNAREVGLERGTSIKDTKAIST